MQGFNIQGGLHALNSKFLNQVIMNKGTLTAVAQHCISCYHIFTIPCFTFTGIMHILITLDPVFPVMPAHIKSLLRPAKLFFKFPPPFTVLFPSVLDFLFGVYPCRGAGWFLLQLQQVNCWVHIFALWPSVIGFKHPQQDFCFARNLVLSFKVFSIKLLQPSSLCLSSQ